MVECLATHVAEKETYAEEVLDHAHQPLSILQNDILKSAGSKSWCRQGSNGAAILQRFGIPQQGFHSGTERTLLYTCIAGDEEYINALARAISACSGPLAGSSRVRWFVHSNSNLSCGHMNVSIVRLSLLTEFDAQMREIAFQDTSVIVREGALGDGLGARIWCSALALCRHAPRLFPYISMMPLPTMSKIVLR